MATKRHHYWVEIAGTCNLRCPSCPTGNYGTAEEDEAKIAIGFMPEERFRAVLERIKSDNAGTDVEPVVQMYTWGEPLLHPKAGRFIRICQEEFGIHAGISSNLSLNVELLPVVRANPWFFRVSLSGYYQDHYGWSHRRGDINLVKSNMYRLRHYMDRTKATFAVQVAYHVYRNNAFDDMVAMERLCEELDFQFLPNFARFNPLEKIFAWQDGTLGAEDRAVLDQLVIPLDKAIDASRKFSHLPCALQVDQTVINQDGSVHLCCATFEEKNLIADDFTKVSAQELQAIKEKHPTCDRCISESIHPWMFYAAHEELSAYGNSVLEELGSPFEVRVRRGSRQVRPFVPRRGKDKA